MTTLKDIAEKCGITPQTVSKILNSKHDHLYRKETCELVQNTARQMNYHPNLSAQAIRKGKSQAVMFLSSSDPGLSNVPEKMLYSIRSGLGKLGYSMMMNALPCTDSEGKKELKRILSNDNVSGILVSISKAIPEWLDEELSNSAVPTVWIGSRHKNNCVVHDDYKSAQEITHRLIAVGHTHIVYVDYLSAKSESERWHFSTSDRMEGYRSAMTESGLTPRILLPDVPLDRSCLVAYSSEHLFGQKTMPDAILSYDMELTGRACLYSALRNGYEIPRDISFVTYHVNPVIENDLNFACFIPSKKDVGCVSVDMLHRLISKKEDAAAPEVLNFEFIRGESINFHRNNRTGSLSTLESGRFQQN